MVSDGSEVCEGMGDTLFVAEPAFDFEAFPVKRPRPRVIPVVLRHRAEIVEHGRERKLVADFPRDGKAFLIEPLRTGRVMLLLSDIAEIAQRPCDRLFIMELAVNRKGLLQKKACTRVISFAIRHCAQVA